jgi:hypothetical protein
VVEMREVTTRECYSLKRRREHGRGCVLREARREMHRWSAIDDEDVEARARGRRTRWGIQ